MNETTTCPHEAVFGGGDDQRYPCTYAKGHDEPHSFEGLNPPSAADLVHVVIGQGGSGDGGLLDRAGLHIDGVFARREDAERYSTMGDMEVETLRVWADWEAADGSAT